MCWTGHVGQTGNQEMILFGLKNHVESNTNNRFCRKGCDDIENYSVEGE